MNEPIYPWRALGRWPAGRLAPATSASPRPWRACRRMGQWQRARCRGWVAPAGYDLRGAALKAIRATNKKSRRPRIIIKSRVLKGLKKGFIY